MTAPDWRQIVRDDLDHLRRAHLFRQCRPARPIDSTHVEIDGLRYVNFASNDYLGLTHHPRVIEAVRTTAARDGTGSGAAALITGYGPAHAAAEAALARWKGVEAAVLLPSGYQANAAAVQTLAAIGERAGGGARFLLDKLCHASLVDAVRATGMPFRIYPHNGLPKLRRLLADAGDNGPGGQLQVVVTESVFSMDGDTADLAGLAALKKSHPFVLLLDEAHGSGVYGPRGSGYAAEVGLRDAVDVSVITLSKALGCAGGAVCGGREFCDALVNYGRPYVFSTSIPPAIAAGAEAAVGVLEDEPWRQQRLRELARRTRTDVRAVGFDLPAGDSPILPLIVGTEEAALAAAAALQEQGLLVPAIRPPTVAKGSSRLRVTLSSEHTDAEVDRLVAALRDMRKPHG